MIPKKNEKPLRKAKSESETATPIKLEPTPKDKLWYSYEDGRGVKYKIANMGNPLVCRRKGRITIEAIRKDRSNNLDLSICTTYDAKNRITYGIPTDQTDKGKIIWKRFKINVMMDFDLSIPSEAEAWAIIRHHEILTGDRPSFRVYDREAIAQAEIAEISLIEEAVRIAKDMKMKDWIPAARFFGHSPEGMSPAIIQSTIMQVAKNTPNELIDYWKMEDRAITDLFNAAKAVGLIAHDFQKGWLYKKTLPMGSTQEQALRFVAKDPAFAAAMKGEVKSLDVSEEAIRSGKTAGKASTFANEEEDDELDILKQKAQLLGIKGFDKLGTEALRTRVSTAEALVLEEESEEGELIETEE